MIALNGSIFFGQTSSFAWPWKKEYNLRHFEWTQWSTAWDGKSTAMEGFTVRTLLYQGQPVYSETREREGGFSIGKIEKKGNERLVAVATVGHSFVKLNVILRHLCGVEVIETLTPHITIKPDHLRMLIEHSQYTLLRERFRDKGWVFQLRKEEGHDDLYLVTAFKSPK